MVAPPGGLGQGHTHRAGLVSAGTTGHRGGAACPLPLPPHFIFSPFSPWPPAPQDKRSTPISSPWSQTASPAPSLPQFPHPCLSFPIYPRSGPGSLLQVRVWGQGHSCEQGIVPRPAPKPPPLLKCTKCSVLSRVCKNPNFLPKESVAGGGRWERDVESPFDGIFILGQSHLQPTHTRSAAASALMSFNLLKGQKIRMKFPLKAKEWPSLQSGRAGRERARGCGAAAWAGERRRVCKVVSVQRCECATS